MVSACLHSDALSQHLPSYLGSGVSPHSCSSKAQPLLLTLDEGCLLTAAPLDLERGVAPLGPHAPAQPPPLGLGVAPLGRHPWPRTCGSLSRPPPQNIRLIGQKVWDPVSVLMLNCFVTFGVLFKLWGFHFIIYKMRTLCQMLRSLQAMKCH